MKWFPKTSVWRNSITYIVFALVICVAANAQTEPTKKAKTAAIAGTVLQLAAMNYTGPHQQLAQSLVTMFNGTEVQDQQAVYDPNDPYGVYADDDYAYEGDYEDSYEESYEESYQTAGYYPADTPSIDAALISKGYDGSLQVVESGATLRGPSVNAPGDRIGVAFAPANDAYIYVVAFDGTGWIQSLYPDPVLGHSNPVRAGQEVLLPGDALYGLDNVTGVETIYVFASNTQRHDIESQLAPFFGKERPAGEQATYRSVERPIIISRGLTGVRPASVNQASYTSSQTSGSSAPVLNSFLAADGVDELVITLWFNHE